MTLAPGLPEAWQSRRCLAEGIEGTPSKLIVFGPMGSIPASRTKKEKPVTKVAGFSFLMALIRGCCRAHGPAIQVFCTINAILVTS